MEIHNMIEASFIIFIKQGGGVLIITIVTGLSNRLFIWAIRTNGRKCRCCCF